MNSFHVNIGHTFAKPYESLYSVLRRCLSVNPGIPYFVIAKRLKDSFPEKEGPYKRLNSLQINQNLPELINFINGSDYEHYSYQRQCPKCASEGYHTDIFVVPSLIFCPLHHCKLTKNCPECNVRWPRKEEIYKRNCATCGIISFEKLKPHSKLEKYKPIEEVFNLLSYKKSDDEEHTYQLMNKVEKGFDKQWWGDISLNSPYYPAYLMFRNNYTPENIDKLGFKYVSLNKISSPLIEVKSEDIASTLSNEEFGNVTISKEGFVNLSISKADKKLLKYDFEVMKKIIYYIKKIKPNHDLNILDYNFINMNDLISGPPACIYCASLSLWFLQSTSKTYGKVNGKNFPKTPFPHINKPPLSFEVTAPFIKRLGEKYYLMNKKMSRWLYIYRQEVLFSYIVYQINKAQKCINYYKKTNSIFVFYDDYFYDFKQHIIKTTYINRKIILHHDKTEPILEALLKIDAHSMNNKECADFREIAVNKKLPEFPFKLKINTSNFSYDDFMLLHQKYMECLEKFYNRPELFKKVRNSKIEIFKES